MPLDAISAHLRDATIASEDRRFWKHAGVDPVGVVRATALDLMRGRAAFGGSTLTMQLARLLDPHPRTLAGKMYEAVMAGRIERALPKREIFEQYLNRVYYGNGAWGAESAARFYFGKPAAALSLGEASFLAVLPRGPEAYDPFRHFDAAIARRRHILGLMQEAGLVTAGARDVAERTPLVFRREHPELRAPHFVEHVLAQLGADERAGATIQTTLDGPLQQPPGDRGARSPGSGRRPGRLAGRRGGDPQPRRRRPGDGRVARLLRRAPRGRRERDHDSPPSRLDAEAVRLRPGAGGGRLRRRRSRTTSCSRESARRRTRPRSSSTARPGTASRSAGSYNLAAVHTLGRVGAPALVDRLRVAGLTTLTEPEDRYPLSLAIGEAEFRIIEYAGAFAAFGSGVVARSRRARSRG